MLRNGKAVIGRNANLFFFIFLSWGLILSLATNGYSQGGLVHREDLLRKSQEAGELRVIVTFYVPDLEKPLATSRQSSLQSAGVIGSASTIALVKEADTALAGKISSFASSLFAGMGLENKINHIFKTVPQAVIMADYEDLITLEMSPQVLRVWDWKTR